MATADLTWEYLPPGHPLVEGPDIGIETSGFDQFNQFPATIDHNYPLTAENTVIFNPSNISETALDVFGEDGSFQKLSADAKRDLADQDCVNVYMSKSSKLDNIEANNLVKCHDDHHIFPLAALAAFSAPFAATLTAHQNKYGDEQYIENVVLPRVHVEAYRAILNWMWESIQEGKFVKFTNFSDKSDMVYKKYMLFLASDCLGLERQTQFFSKDVDYFLNVDNGRDEWYIQPGNLEKSFDTNRGDGAVDLSELKSRLVTAIVTAKLKGKLGAKCAKQINWFSRARSQEFADIMELKEEGLKDIIKPDAVPESESFSQETFEQEASWNESNGAAITATGDWQQSGDGDNSVATSGDWAQAGALGNGDGQEVFDNAW